MIHYGWLWLALVGFGWLWLALVAFSCNYNYNQFQNAFLITHSFLMSCRQMSMKTPAMLATPRFDAEASKRIVAEATKRVSENRKRQLQKYAEIANRAFSKN